MAAQLEAVIAHTVSVTVHLDALTVHIEAVTSHTSPTTENIEAATAHIAAASAHTVSDTISTDFNPTVTARVKWRSHFLKGVLLLLIHIDHHSKRGFNPSDQHRLFASVTETE